MQSGGRYDIGRNQMYTIVPAGGSSAYIGGTSEDSVMEKGKSANLIRLEDGPGIGELTLVKETVNTLQPIDDGTTGEHIDSTTDGVNDYKGNNAIRAYNFLIEDTSDQMRLSQGVEDIGETDKVAVSMKTLKAVKEDLEDQIAAITGGEGAYLTKTEAASTYETILNHASDKQALESSISSKANSADVYTKAQVDSSLSAKADASTTYTKSEVDSALSSKANSSDVYTKAQTNALIPDVSAYFPKESPEDEDHNVSELVWDQTKFAIKTAESVAAEIVLDAVHSKIETPELIAHGALTATRCLVDTLCMAGAHSSNTEVKYIVVDDDYDAKKNSQTFDKQKAIATFKTMVEKYYDKNESYNKDEVDNLIDGATGEPETTKRYQINTHGTYQASEGFHKGDLAIEAVRAESISDNDYNKSTYRSIWEPIFVVQLYNDEEVFTEPEYLFNWVLTLDIPGKDDSPYTFNMKYEPALDSSGNVIENTWLLVTNDNKTSIVDERITYSYSLRAYHGHDYSVADERDVEWRIGSDCLHAGDSNYESSGLWRSIYHNVSSKRMSFREKLELYYNLLDNRYLNLENSTNLRRIHWDGTELYIQTRAQTTDSWTNKILINPNTAAGLSYITMGKLYLNNNASVLSNYVDSIVTSSTSAISTSNTAIATGGYVDNYYLSKTGTAANASKLEWTYNNATYSLVPKQYALQMKSGSNVKGYINAGGSITTNYFNPMEKIGFGNKLDSAGTGVEADSTKWRGDLVNIANSTYYANRSTTPYSSVSDLDTLVPSFKVLNDNYLTMNNADNDRRIVWDGKALSIETYSSNIWSKKGRIVVGAGAATSSLSIGSIYLNSSASTSGNYVSSILTSSTSAISTANYAIATGGYVDNYYYDKTTSDAKYLSMNNTNDLRRIVWNGAFLYVQSRNATTDAWTNKILIGGGPANGDSYITTKSLYLNNNATETGNFVNSILTSSTSAISSSNYAIATGGYVDEYYASKSDLQGLFSMDKYEEGTSKTFAVGSYGVSVIRTSVNLTGSSYLETGVWYDLDISGNITLASGITITAFYCMIGDILIVGNAAPRIGPYVYEWSFNARKRFKLPSSSASESSVYIYATYSGSASGSYSGTVSFSLMKYDSL